MRFVGVLWSYMVWLVCLYTLFCLSSGLLKQENKHMGRPKRLYLLGRYWSRVPKDVEADKAYLCRIDLESADYLWNDISLCNGCRQESKQKSRLW